MSEETVVNTVANTVAETAAKDLQSYSGRELAYLGDAVLELLVREHLLLKSSEPVGALNREALQFVKATAQSRAAGNVWPLLTSEEQAVFKRGRNNHLSSVPKSASAQEYRRATGLEALFGWLWLTGGEARAKELFRLAYFSPKEGISPELTTGSAT